MRRLYRLTAAVLSIFLLMPVLAACTPGQPASSGDDPSVSTGSTEETSASLVWPTEAMGQLPAPDGKISAVTRDTDSRSVTVLLESMNRDQAEAYLLTTTAAGYELLEKTEGDGTLMAQLGSSTGQISFLYFLDDEACSLTFFTLTDPVATPPVDPAAAWPETWTGLPVLQGEISEILVYDERDAIVYFSEVDPAVADDYVRQLSERFVLDIAQQRDDHSLFFTGSDPQGVYLEFFWADDQTASLKMIKPLEPVETTET